MSRLHQLQIGDKIAQLPIIQGGMGVGVSLCNLAGAVAREGGIGIISTAQIGYEEENFTTNTSNANIVAIKKNIKKAKEIAKGNGLVGVNIMVALKDYKEHVQAAIEAKADVIISGAGLPIDLPSLIGDNNDTKIAPIVSSKKAADIILKLWSKKYNKTADFVVIEGPKAGGHLGFNEDEVGNITNEQFDEEIVKIINCVKEYEDKFDKKIPVIVAGGIFDRKDIDHAINLGASGVQIASRFVATNECDASYEYKMAYINAKKEDITIIKSPVGMPGRALRNEFIKRIELQKEKITKCYGCLNRCNPKEIPYCITKALINAVKGDLDNGLIFCGENVDRIDKITSVHELMEELAN